MQVPDIDRVGAELGEGGVEVADDGFRFVDAGGVGVEFGGDGEAVIFVAGFAGEGLLLAFAVLDGRVRWRSWWGQGTYGTGSVNLIVAVVL